MDENKTDIEAVRALVADIKSGPQVLSALTQEIASKAREYILSPEKYREMLDFSARFHHYSFHNCMLIAIQNPNSTYVGSFKHFKDLGYSVSKGEHGMKILVPVLVKFIKVDGEAKRLSEASRDEKIQVADGELPVFEKTFFKPGTVFDISQTNVPEADLPKFYGYMAEKPDSQLQLQCMYDMVDEHGIDIEINDLKSVALKGYYQPADDKIVLNQRLNAANRLKTLTHEFAHAILHKNNPDMPKGQMEFEAESTAYIALRQMGVDLKDYQFDYIGQYFSQFRAMKDADIDSSLKRINRASNYIADGYRQQLDAMTKILEAQQEQGMEQEEAEGQSLFKNRKRDVGNEENPLA